MKYLKACGDAFLMSVGILAITWFFPQATYWAFGIAFAIYLIAVIRPFALINSRIAAISSVIIFLPAFLIATLINDPRIAETKRLSALKSSNPELYQQELADKATAEAETERASQCGQGNYLAAVVRAQYYVKNSLKAPSTASFPFSSKGITTVLGDCTFRVASHVDAQNSFGATVRSNYLVVLHNNYPDKSWSLIEIDIN